MDDLTQKLQALLSDPESMRNLSELAGMLHSDATEHTQPEEPQADTDSCSSAEPPPFDFAKLMAVGQALSSIQQDDETAALILALKPHLSEQRARRADQAVRMLRLYSAAGVLMENGMLADLFGANPQ